MGDVHAGREMVSFYEPPIGHIVAGLAALIGMYSAVRGARRLARGVRQATSLDVVRGIRGFVVAVGAAALAIGILSAERGFLVFGAIFLGEELYETGVLAAILRFGERASEAPPAGQRFKETTERSRAGA